MSVLNQQVRRLFDAQLTDWDLAAKNYEGLKQIQTKSFSFGDFEVAVQFNPARIVSTGAKTDAKSIAERPCFLCAENRPAQQRGVNIGEYEVLVNPFPVFPEHYTIPSIKHRYQEIWPVFGDMLNITKLMDHYLVFYNGPRCGASAPDHLHFQAGTKSFLPLVSDYFRMKFKHASLISHQEKTDIFLLKNYLRTIICIESEEEQGAVEAFRGIYRSLQTSENEEPMMNIVCFYQHKKWFCMIIPRAAFRPWQYTADGDNALLVSPATVEMSGIFITPLQSDFEKIQKDDIESILKQCSPVHFKLKF
jgi:ATP adenylyltransferase/5',5'''-P-1,P-4-tetraphosphate phosphorylase II